MIEKKQVEIPPDIYIKWFFELSSRDVSIAGGKGASLAEMYNNKFPVPPGFMITAQAFNYFLDISGLRNKISEILKDVDTEETESLDERSKEIRRIIENQKMPEDLQKDILEAYHILSSEKVDTTSISENALNILKTAREPIFVSIRSSATSEDLADASFAGQQESFLNVKGDKDLIEYVKKCMSSLFTSRAIYYRNRKGFEEGKNALAVVVQKMVDSEKSGVMFSKDPVNFNEDIIIEAVFGLGEGIVSGKINPDNYVVTRDLKIKKVSVMAKKIAIIRTAAGHNDIVKLSSERSKSQVLTSSEILELANYALKLEEHYEKPQDIEFAIEDKKIYIVQSRPITTLEKRHKNKVISGNVILMGMGASPGIGVGPVRIINHMDDLPSIKKGDVLVTEMTNPDMVVAMRKSVAIVTNEGGLTSHASIVSREMGIPCVVGTVEATSILKDGMRITVDGGNGKVYEGEVAETSFAEIKPAVPTRRIKIKLMLDLPDFAERAKDAGIDSIGLVRLEGIIAENGKHPLLYEQEDKTHEYSKIIEEGIEKISTFFKSIWIRASDIRSDEYSILDGAPEREVNPMLGFHGLRFSLKHPKILIAELEAIKRVAQKYPDKKFGIMFPQVISVDEVKKAKEYFNKVKTPNMHIGVMIETPAAVQVIEQICEVGIDFISFGTNDLTQYTLAVDRGNEEVQYLYNELDPSVLMQIKRVINICKRYGVETSICGQAGSNKKMVEFLFDREIDSISVNADAAYEISNFIKELESRIDEEKETNGYIKREIFRGKNNRWRNKKRWLRRQQEPFERNVPENLPELQEQKQSFVSMDELKRNDEVPLNVGTISKIEGIDDLAEVELKGEKIQEDFKMNKFIDKNNIKIQAEPTKEEGSEEDSS
jgi:pyruvate, water dikinase